MPRFTSVQGAHNYGVLDPVVIERRDTKYVGGSLSDAENIIVLPQGGYTDRGGTEDFGRVRRKLQKLTLTTGMLTLPNGGTASDFLNVSATITTGAAAGSRFVLFEIDLGISQPVVFFDVAGVSIATTGASGALIAEYYNGSTWVAFGAAQELTRDALSRRFASGAPGQAGINAQRFRIAVNASGAASGAVSFTGGALWLETATRSDGIVRTFSPRTESTFQFVFTDNNADVFQAGVWQAAIAVPVTETILRRMKPEGRYNTMLLFERELRPQRIFWLEQPTEWACDPVPFRNIPLQDFGGVYTNGVTEIQALQFYGFAEGDPFELLLEGNTTETIVIGPDAATTMANIKAGLEALPNVNPGLTVTIGGGQYIIEFTGEGNAERDWLPMSAVALNTDGYISVRTTTDGRAPGEPVISASRGWPAVGRFAKQRLIMAGMKSQPLGIIASQTGDPFDLNTELELATAGFNYEIDSSASTQIHDMFVSNTIVFFGDLSAMFLRSSNLSAEEVPDFGSTDAPGIDIGISPVSSNNAIFYVQDGGSSLQLMNYTEIEQNYVSDNASVLSAHLIRKPVDLAKRRATGIVDSDLNLVVGNDGTMTAQTIMRTQDVSGFTPWRTDGFFRSVAVDRDNQVWLLVDREVDGVPQLRLELMRPDLFLDESACLDFAEPTTTLTGLERFNGRTVWVIANDSSYGPYEVSNGAVTLPDLCSTACVGTWIAPMAEDPPIVLEDETRNREARLKRVNRMQVSVYKTTSLAVRANDGPVHNLPLVRNDQVGDLYQPHSQPNTGWIEAEGMHGFTPHGKTRVTQVYPGRLTVRAVTKNIAA